MNSKTPIFSPLNGATNYTALLTEIYSVIIIISIIIGACNLSS